MDDVFELKTEFHRHIRINLPRHNRDVDLILRVSEAHGSCTDTYIQAGLSTDEAEAIANAMLDRVKAIREAEATRKREAFKPGAKVRLINSPQYCEDYLPPAGTVGIISSKMPELDHVLVVFEGWNRLGTASEDVSVHDLEVIN
jgi:hypothetical protein